MVASRVLTGWGRILGGFQPTLSLEITRECPLRCPGCYAYGEDHLGGGVVLRELRDYKGQQLIDGVMDVVRRLRPTQVSIVGGEPLVRYRELDELLPKLSAMGVMLQVVTSAVRPIPESWATIPGLLICVSIDGLAPEHNVRRAPATYDRILKHIKGHQIVVHCTVTRQQSRPGYLTEFSEFWNAQPDVKAIWFSLYTPQKGEESAERLLPEDRARVVQEIDGLRGRLEKLRDMRPGVLQAYLNPPKDPGSCIFAQTTTCLSADLTTKISPCQFGGDPDCSQCGCVASAALDAIGRYKLPGGLRAGQVYWASRKVGNGVRRLRGASAT
jgi:MoaA/NifB/PqqE/SkfB family radical SAM enzyme